MAGKKKLQFNVRMSEEDYALLERAAGVLWPRAILSQSALILGLAKIAAEDALKAQKKKC